MQTQIGSRRSTGRDVKKPRRAALALGVLVGSILCANAWAAPGHGHGHGHHFGHHHHGGAHVGLFFGAPPLFWHDDWHDYGPYWYDPPYYRYNLVPAQPPVYIERGAAGAKPLWYFCSDPQGYYPYVKQCSTDWRPVAPESVLR